VNYPSVKTLSAVFGDNAKQARAILTANHSTLIDLFEAAGLASQYYLLPKNHEIKLILLDLLAGTQGVESIHNTAGISWAYLNAGATYATTLIRKQGGRYFVGCWGDIVENRRNGVFL
jgi:hypothetical protein